MNQKMEHRVNHKVAFKNMFVHECVHTHLILRQGPEVCPDYVRTHHPPDLPSQLLRLPSHCKYLCTDSSDGLWFIHGNSFVKHFFVSSTFDVALVTILVYVL